MLGAKKGSSGVEHRLPASIYRKSLEEAMESMKAIAGPKHGTAHIQKGLSRDADD